MTEDLALVRRVLAGDERAFDELFTSTFGPLYRFALARMGRDEDAAEEVAQAALARAISKLSTYRGEAALLTWLCTFCRHEIAAFYERARRAPPTTELVEDRLEVRAALDTLARADGNPEDAAQRRETGRLVHVALDRLPPRYGDALEWKYVEGLSVAEIAARLSVTPKAAESLLTRAREAFRDAFATLTEAGRSA